mmetsp:Transcript_30482/g.60641  ORF Transcript_30482/g.60641 Transcript_30482/m.60641 type:complete len:204 (-) Transcript_30482:152-763(-)
MAELSVQLSSLSHLALLTCLQAECWGEDVVPDEASDTEAACGFEPSCGPTREEGHTEKPRDLEQVGGQAHGCEAEADEPRKALGPRRLPVHMQPQRVRDEVALKKCCRMMVQLVRCSRPARMRTDCSSMNWSSLPAETLWPMSKSELLPNKRYPKDTFGLGLVVSAGAGASAVVITPLGASRNFSNAASPTSFKASILKRTFN